MTLLCHLLAMFSNPGENPIWEKSLESLKEIKQDLYCKKCLLVRPERTHHCKICEKCILKMDHHCPWIANCVGLKNIKHFFLFLFYATVGDCIAFGCLISKIIYIDLEAKINESLALGVHNNNSNVSYNSSNTNNNGSKASAYNQSAFDLMIGIQDPLICFFGTILAFFMTLSIGFLFAVQLLNLLRNKTTIEMKIYENRDSPYKHSHWRQNFESVMGKGVFFWFFPYYHEDEKFNAKKDKKQNNYLSLCNVDDNNNNLELNVPEI